MLNEYGLFTEETLILEHSQNLVKTETLDCIYLKSEYELLSVHYKKLLDQSKKLVSMADKTHKKLKESNDLVNEKVSELTIVEEQLKKLTITDPLTNLLNRRGIMNWLNDEGIRFKRNANPFTLFLIDIDFFKEINDEYGHNIGDITLKVISETMNNSIRAQDYIARWGGDEFLLVLPETSLDGGFVIAEKMRKKIAEHNIIKDNINLDVTISLGGCDFREGMTIYSCLEMADKALYRSKANGRNMVSIYEY